MSATVDTIALLLADHSPALRYRALVEVDGAAADDAEVVALRGELGASTDVARVLAEVESAPEDGRELGYALCRLAYVGLQRGDAAVDSLAERVFAFQQKDGSWPLARAGAARRSGQRAPLAEEDYQWIPMQTALPLRGLAAAGYATDPRAERGYEWLLSKRLDDGSWPTGHIAGQRRRVMGYRRLPRSEGCRTNTTAAAACFAHHPERRASEDGRAALDLLLQRETRDEWALGFEVARLLGAERLLGFITFYARFDLAFLLDIAARMGAAAGDPRLADLLAFLQARRGPYGLWEHPTHPHLGRWLTLDLLASIRRLESGDWIGSDLRVSFTAYPRRRQRY